MKTISKKYLKKSTAVTPKSSSGTPSGSLLNRLRNKHKCRDENQIGRSSFRSFSCGTLPGLDDFQRNRIMATSSVLQDEISIGASSELHDARSLHTERDISSPMWPGEGDTDSGIVQEWSDTSSISEVSYARHFQPVPCQMLSSWRKPAPRVRSSLSPIFQYKPRHVIEAEDQVDSAAYETLWPPNAHQPDASDAHLKPAPEATRDAIMRQESAEDHTMRIHIEYPAATGVQMVTEAPHAADLLHAHQLSNYQTASLDRRTLSAGGHRFETDGVTSTSVHLIKIERRSDRLSAELGIFIAKKKLAQGNTGYVVAHIVPNGLVER